MKDVKNNIIKLGQIGIGYWGPNLLRNIVANKNCKIKSIVDLDKNRRSFVKSLYPSLSVNSHSDDIINDKEIDAVVISTPVSTHYDLAMDCLESGKHILVEKPMATNVNEVKKISNLANAKGLIAMVGHTFLFNPAVRYIKKHINNGELGDIRYIYSQRVNLGRIRKDVDALWNLAPHDVSIIQYWLDNPDPISISKNGKAYVQNDIDDVVFMNILYPGNIMANIHVSWLDPCKIRKMTIVGSKKMIVYNDISEHKIEIYDKGIDRMAVLGERMDFDDPNSYLLDHRSGDLIMPKIEWTEPLKLEIEHFVDCIINGSSCITDAFHAEKVVQILSKS